MARALLSVSDKTGIVDFAKELVCRGMQILSTGGTLAALAQAGVPVTPVSDITGFPECLDGRVKTLHPAIHGGLLAMRAHADHMAQIQALGIAPIDLVAVNLYPFRQTVAKPGVDFAEAVENIDIGGPTMLRSAAKNWQDVTVLVDPADYPAVLREMDAGGVSPATRRRLSYKVFAHTAQYDALIADYLWQNLPAREAAFPDSLTLTYEKTQDMRYGENPHQPAAFYRELGDVAGCLSAARQLHGKALSYNNINDANGALDLLREFDTTAVVAVKHANPCGVGLAGSVADAYRLAYQADPISIFGGIVAANGVIDEAAASLMAEIFLEIILAPGFTPQALALLTRKKNIRLLQMDTAHRVYPAGALDMKKVAGGLLVQRQNDTLLPAEPWRVVTRRAPTPVEEENLRLAWAIVKHTKSNGIVIAKSGQSLGIGPGQVNRIWAAQAAIARSGDKARGAALASDAFFPFEDCAQAAAGAGISAIIQPGGSLADQKSIDVCDAHNIAMVFTGMRHFKH
ncbi:MAG: bifunctional phosphoribosylaminoimidazolecarboxamide formyltransferase/IMP cyclohydrolase [Oscillospiraceae bacterium]|jgi:phosphoribosylaminoimidazolecarboxamide formyltransferase/IMP cyclohydrolase|nr:bifunctional phosphoribosylaminoimidazolecarboxamide formyltransferase/IMP cyclohydrolase [Oscillospiraceae bacterium]